VDLKGDELDFASPGVLELDGEGIVVDQAGQCQHEVVAYGDAGQVHRHAIDPNRANVRSQVPEGDMA
jgi:hypothetical protein